MTSLPITVTSHVLEHNQRLNMDVNPILQALKEAISSKRALSRALHTKEKASELLLYSTASTTKSRHQQGGKAPENKLERILTHIAGDSNCQISQVNEKQKSTFAAVVEVKQVADLGYDHGLEVEKIDFSAEILKLEKRVVDQATETEVIAFLNNVKSSESSRDGSEIAIMPEFMIPFNEMMIDADVLNDNLDEMESSFSSKLSLELEIPKTSLTSKKTVVNTWSPKKSKTIKKSKYMTILQDQQNINSFQKKNKDMGLGIVSASSKSDSPARQNFPTVPKKFVDPAILIVEKQLQTWDKLVKEMYKRRKLEKPQKRKRITKFEVVGAMVLKLQILGLSVNLVNRVDRSTLSIVLAIRMWKKKALDIRSNRSAPIRKLVAVFDRQLAINVPVPIARSIIEHTLEILQLCHRRYQKSLGPKHYSATCTKDRMSALLMNLPSAPLSKDRTITIRNVLRFKESVRIYPSTFEELDQLEQGQRRIEKFSLDSSDSLNHNFNQSRPAKKIETLSPFETIEEELERAASQKR